MPKFIQPVSMRCTQEQYDKDLKQPLLEMGYQEGDLTRPFDWCDTLYTNYNGCIGLLGITSCKNGNDLNRHFIDHYNPQLFLALAAMTDSPDGIKGEWWKYVGKSGYVFTSGRLYKQITKSINFECAFVNDKDASDGWHPNNHKKFTKPTKDEIIQFFTNKNNTKQPVMDKIVVKKADFKKLHDMACTGWKPRLDKVVAPFVYDDTISFAPSFVEEMRKACTDTQRPVFESIFGAVKSDKNPFKEGLDWRDHQEALNKLFKQNNIVELAIRTPSDIGRDDLLSRSFYVNTEHSVILHNALGGGTIIEIVEK